MEVIKYLKENGLAKLVTEFAIKVKEYDEGLIVLNYDQFYSVPKAHPIVVECRGLILDKEFNVVSRSFDRFFNIGEQPDTQTHINMSKAVCFDKIDGSLIRMYNWQGVWYVATRGTAFAESSVNGFDLTFKDLVLKALCCDEGSFQSLCNDYLSKDVSYICEVTSMENRVVRRYEGYQLHYLAARNNLSFEYEDCADICSLLGMIIPNAYSFETAQDCIETAKTLTNLDEGYVLYQGGIPVCKIKSPAYCCVHLLRGEGLNPKRIAELVLTGEQDEYTSYFPEDKVHIDPYVETLDSLLLDIDLLWEASRGLETQKDFALSVKESKGSACLFYLRKNGGDTASAWNAQADAYKLKVLLEAVK